MSDSQLQETLAQYRQYLEQSGLSPVTIKSYVGDIKHFASWLIQTRRKCLLESTGEDIRAYRLQLVTAKAHLAATVNRHLQSIRKFHRYASESGLVKEDPSLEVKLLPQRESQAARGLDQSEIERLLEAVRNGSARLVDRDYAIVQLMLQTGIRVGELTRLRISDVLVSAEGGVLRISGQGAYQNRDVPLNASVRKALSAYLRKRPRSSSNHLFLSRTGDPLSVRSVQRLVNTHGRAAGLDKVSTYTLRQTCGQHMLRDTGDLSLVARFLGHKRVETAIRYILPGREDLTEVAERSSLNVY